MIISAFICQKEELKIILISVIELYCTTELLGLVSASSFTRPAKLSS